MAQAHPHQACSREAFMLEERDTAQLSLHMVVTVVSRSIP